MITEALRKNLDSLYASSVKTETEKFGSKYISKSDGTTKLLKNSAIKYNPASSINEDFIVEDASQVVVEFSDIYKASDKKLPFFVSLKTRLFGLQPMKSV